KTSFALYEVLDVVPGESITLQDLIRPYPPRLVHEKTASRQVHISDHLLVKVIEPQEGYFTFTGCIFKMPTAASDKWIKNIHKDIRSEGLTLNKRTFSEAENLAGINLILQDYSWELIGEGLRYLRSEVPEL